MSRNSREQPFATMETAGELLNRGKTWQALMAFYDVRDQQMQDDTSGRPSGEVMQMIGVCCRMLRYYQRAEDAFKQAIDLAGDNLELRGKIYRDWSMVPLVQGDIQRAGELAVLSQSCLLRFPRELEITKAFIGRVFMKRGDYMAAVDFFREVDGNLAKMKDTRTPRLNSLVWWLKVESNPIKRVTLGCRGLQYAVANRNPKRVLQILLLLAVGPYERYHLPKKIKR